MNCTFPENEQQAIALLYAQLHGTADDSPKDLYQKYLDALDALKEQENRPSEKVEVFKRTF